MKLLRVGQPGHEKPAILDAEGKVRDLSPHVKDIGGDAISPEGLKKIAAIDLASLPVLSDDRIGACVSGTLRRISAKDSSMPGPASANSDAVLIPDVSMSRSK